MENNIETDIQPIDGSMVVDKNEAARILKEHDNKVTNGDIDAFVSLKDINKIYPNGVQAVYDFNIDIKEHDFIVLVGPSGCGKSTTLRMIAGLEDITSGYLYINKVLSNYLPSKDRDISMVFQSYALYPQMTVYDNIAFPLRVRRYRKVVVDKVVLGCNQAIEILKTPQALIDAQKEAADKNLNYTTVVSYISTKFKICDNASKLLLSFKIKDVTDLDKLVDGKTYKEVILTKIDQMKQEEITKQNNNGYTLDEKCQLLKDGKIVLRDEKLNSEEIRNKVFEAARILDLGPYLDRRPKELSGGQMQRVALGRAIVRDAKLFLMDEPLSNLDAKLRVAMRSEIVRIHEQIGATTIYVTHDQTEAMTMATRIAVMSKGWVQQIGEPQKIYNYPKNIFVATFIGSPAMNIFKGEYDNGVVTLSNGFKVKLSNDFITKHDNFYKDKIADMERILSLPDFKKMHALKIVDESLFDNSVFFDADKIERETKNLIDMLSHKEDEDSKNIMSYLAKISNLDHALLKDQINYVKAKNNIEKMKQVKDVVDTIDDEHGKVAANLIDEQIALAETAFAALGEQEVSLYDEYVSAIKKALDIAKKSEEKGYSLVVKALDEIDCVDSLPKEAKDWMHLIRKELLTFEKISSDDIGKLHNAQIFNKVEAQNMDTIYYKKGRNKDKKQKKVKVNLNSVDIRFVNNLYDVAYELLQGYKRAVAGKHEVKLGIRPEHIHLDNEFIGEIKTEPFTIESEVVELMGSELLVHAQWNDEDMIAKISTGTIVKPHTKVDLAFDSSKVLIFDVGSGDTIL